VAIGGVLLGAVSLGAVYAMPNGASPAPRGEGESAATELAAATLAPKAPTIGATNTRTFQDGEVVRLAKGTHHELTFARPISRIAIGDPTIVEQQTLTNKQVLLRGLAIGRTSLIVWYEDGSHERTDVHVEKDIALLQGALKDIHPSLTVEIAPDREAYVLRGRVPNMLLRRAAEQAAEAYLDAGRAPVLVGTGEAADTAVVSEESQRRRGSIINLVRVDELAPSQAVRLQIALVEAGFDTIFVRTVQSGELADEATEIIVLEGTVEDQIDLSRVLSLVGRLVEGGDGDLGIEVIADEAGALRDSVGQTSSSQSASAASGFGTSSGSSAGLSRVQLDNQVDANIARASILSTANGRVLSFIEVTDLPQVRVQVEFYEIDKNGLKEVRPKLGAAISDFDAAGVGRSPLTTQFQGTPTGSADAPFSGGIGTGPTSETDVQNVVNFLDGTFANEVQLATGRLALSATLRFLEEQGVARSLSRPTLTVLSGESAQFLVGGEIPVRQSAVSDASGGVITTSVTTEQFGIGLAVRPLVGRDGRVTLDLQPEVTEPDFDLTAEVVAVTGTSQETIGFRTRTMRTSARLEDGQALLVGGLQTRLHDGVKSKFPVLGSLPLLGWLFRETAEQSAQTELVIVVTPVVLREPEARALLWAHRNPFDALLDAVAPPAAPTNAREGEGSGA
jgi:Flp pilus assembly secretin CpaC